MEDDDPFASQRRWRRAGGIAIVTFIVVAIAGTIGFFVYRDPRRVLRKHRAELEAQRDQYCRVLAAEKARGEKGIAVVSGEPVTRSSAHFGPQSGPPRPGNADAIEMPQLEKLCSHQPVSSGTLVDSSLLADLLDESSAERYDHLAYEAGIALAARSKYLVVVDVSTLNSNVITGKETMAAGEFVGRASLYSLADGVCLGTIDANDSGPEVVTIYRQKTLFPKDENDVGSPLVYESARHALRTIASSFTRNGRDVQLED